MTSFAYRSRHGVAIAALMASLISFWLMLVPETLSAFTYALSVTAIVAVGVVTLNSYRNGQPTGSMAQLLHETEVGRREE